MKFTTQVFAFMLSALFSTASLQADIKLPAIFSDHMVLAKQGKVPIWGKADSGEEVTITLGPYSGKATTGSDGRWRVELDLRNAGTGPFEMTVAGKNTLKVSDVVIGEVWLASGQSNMQWELENTDAKDEIAQSANPMLREFKVERSAVPEPAEDCVGRWTVAGPETSGRFSAIGYYFGKNLQSELKVPVGIINTNWGGSPVEAWISSAAIDSVPDLKASRERYLDLLANAPTRKTAFVDGFGKWLTENHREDRVTSDPSVFAAESVSPEGWKVVELPGTPVAAPGAFWLRREFEVPAMLAGKKSWINLGVFDGFESVYLNGQLIAQTTYQHFAGGGIPHVTSIPNETIKAGKNVLAIRVFAPVEPVQFSLFPKLLPTEHQGSWRMKTEFAFPALSPAQITSAPEVPFRIEPLPLSEMAGFLFNGMIHPIAPYGVDGVIWYQGESNLARAWQYRDTFALLIKDWRAAWKKDDLHFYFCQLANYQTKEPQPGESMWAELREAQSKNLEIPQTAQAVLIDLGESLVIHPRDKKAVGDRLARIALSQEYGKKIPYSGPVYQSFKIEGGKVRLRFTRTDGGLVAKPLPATYDEDALAGLTSPLVPNSPDSEVEGFAICGKDRKWFWADAKIDGETVVVWSDKVPNPVAVRYAWADNPTCNLYNGAGLPASPFRTDDFPAITLNAEY